MDKQLRDLAFAIVKQQSIKKDEVNKLLDSLSDKQLRNFLYFLRVAQDSNKIEITTTSDSPKLDDYFAKNFPDKQISYKTDDTIGGGVVVKIGDDVYDYTVRNYIDTTIQRLTNEL